MTEKQFIKEIEKNREFSITPEVEAAIANYAGKSFRIPLQTSKVAHNTIDGAEESEDVEMEEEPINGSDSDCDSIFFRQ